MNASPFSHRSRHGFTLIELLVVMVIIALLASLVLPVMGSVFQKTDLVKCGNNLRQLATAAHFAAQDNDGVYPIIESDPGAPIFLPEDGAKPIGEALGKYGISEKQLQCPTDLHDGSKSQFARCGSSYFWYPYSDDAQETSISIYTRRGAFPRSLARVQLAADWTALHPTSAGAGAPRRFNVVYADGHVLMADQARGKKAGK